MTDPVTIGAIVAALVSGAAGKLGEDAVDEGTGVVKKLVERLRERFTQLGETGTVATLEDAIERPESPSSQDALAAVVDRYVAADSGFREEVERFLKEAQSAKVDVKAVTQTAWGDQSVQVANVTGSPITFTFGQQRPYGGY
jgi:hypothetical protein